MRRALSLASLLLISAPAVAFAEPPPGGYQESAPPPGGEVIVVEQATVQPVDPQPAPPPPATEPQSEGRGIQYGFYGYVPIWLTSPVEERLGVDVTVKPGFGVLGRIGWEFPNGLSTELFLGYQVNTVQVALTVGDTSSSTSGKLRYYAFGGGLRYAFLNPTAWVPFVGASLQIAVWSGGCGRTPDEACVSESLLGFGTQLGVIYEISADLGVEAGALLTASLPGDAFDGMQFWLSPFLGVTLYY